MAHPRAQHNLPGFSGKQSSLLSLMRKVKREGVDPSRSIFEEQLTKFEAHPHPRLVAAISAGDATLTF